MSLDKESYDEKFRTALRSVDSHERAISRASCVIDALLISGAFKEDEILSDMIVAYLIDGTTNYNHLSQLADRSVKVEKGDVKVIVNEISGRIKMVIV